MACANGTQARMPIDATVTTKYQRPARVPGVPVVGCDR